MTLEVPTAAEMTAEMGRVMTAEQIAAACDLSPATVHYLLQDPLHDPRESTLRKVYAAWRKWRAGQPAK